MGDEALVKHAGGLVTLKVPLIAVGKVRADFISIDESACEGVQMRGAVENPSLSERVPIVSMAALVYMKLKAGRQKDIADLVELLKRGKIDVVAMDQHIEQNSPEQSRKWERVKELAAREE